LKHCWHWEVSLFKASNASASSRVSASGDFSKKKANLEADFGPIPGKREKASIRF